MRRVQAFVRVAAVVAAFTVATVFAQPIPGGSLNPSVVPKYVQPLVKPPAMPQSREDKNKGKAECKDKHRNRHIGQCKQEDKDKHKDKYDLAVRQFDQQILPSGTAPMTTVWSYGPSRDVGPDNTGKTVAQGGSYHYPAFTIEATADKTTQVIWRNELRDGKGNFRPHLLPVDPTLHWANPPGGTAGRDTRPEFNFTPGPYTGPVPIITHVHGAHTTEDADGFPEAWYLPDANNIPAGFARTGTFFDYFNQKYDHDWEPGAVSFKYPNSQRATTLWYHDHTAGMTRSNVYAGPAGFWLIRGGPDDLNLGYAAPGLGSNPFGNFTEIPIAIQDRSFNADGSLFYPDSRAFFDGFPGPFVPTTPVSPIWNPEFFGNHMVVNGQTWPYLDVEPRRYRLRLLNGCNSRFLNLSLRVVTDPGTAPDYADATYGEEVPFYVIGTEGGFLPKVVRVTAGSYAVYETPGQAPVVVAGTPADQALLMGLAERMDVIVDFTGLAPGTRLRMLNTGPDVPFSGFPLEAAADIGSTGQVMELRVGSLSGTDNTTAPQNLVLPAKSSLGTATRNQYVSLNEAMFQHPNFPEGEGPVAALLGRYNPDTLVSTPLLWMDPITENPAKGGVEDWRIMNLTADAHPIHIHLVQFEVVGREAIGGGPSVSGDNDPQPFERGFKDTVIAYPGEITTVRARFDIAGLFVWHCHIVEHEDNEMMRPYNVGPIDPNLPKFHHPMQLPAR